MKIHDDHQQAVHRETRRPLFQKSMRRPLASMTTLALLASLLAVSPGSLYAQIDFSSGSDGSFGPINVTTGTETLDPPADGIFNATTITVAQGATLTFTRNPLNTPIFLLATGDIEIVGTINVRGQNGSASPPLAGRGGPGGFDGGAPGIAAALPGDGLGPGGGGGGTNNRSAGSDGAGLGAYGGTGNIALPANGNAYGSPLLVPVVGGSGGGGLPGNGGGGGGGAILLASDTRVNITGSILANGGIGSIVGHGSGGGIRIVSPVVSGTGLVDVRGGTFSTFGIFVEAGSGRIRVDLINRSQLGLDFRPVSAISVGAFMQVFPPVVPRLDIVNVAGQAIPEGTAGPVQVLLPFGSPTTQEVTIQARDFSGVVPIEVVLTPDIGPRTVVEAEIDNSTANPAQIVVPVEIPVNVVTHVNVWTR